VWTTLLASGRGSGFGRRFCKNKLLNNYLKRLNHCDIILFDLEDELKWSWDTAHGQVSAKKSYDVITHSLID